MPPWRRSPLAKTLADLLAKYDALVALRQAREAYQQQGIIRLEGQAAKARQGTKRLLASRFPGALRELEACCAHRLLARRLAVFLEWRAAVQRPRRRLPKRRWVRVVLDYHAALRDGLGILAWLGQADPNRTRRHDQLERFVAWYAHSPARQWPLGEVDGLWLRGYLRLPEGRLSALVWHQLAQRHKTHTAHVRHLVLHGGLGPPKDETHA